MQLSFAAADRCPLPRCAATVATDDEDDDNCSSQRPPPPRTVCNLICPMVDRCRIGRPARQTLEELAHKEDTEKLGRERLSLTQCCRFSAPNTVEKALAISGNT